MITPYLYLRCLFMLLSLALLTLPPARSEAIVAEQPATESVIEPAGSIGGSVQAVAVGDGFAYISEGDALTVLDVHNPALPVRYGQTLVRGHIARMQVIDQIVYALVTYDGYAGTALQLIDVSDPRYPIPRTYYDNVNNVRVVGSIAYVAQNYPAQLLLLDVHNPAMPTELGSYPMDGSPTDLQVVGTLAYVAGYMDAILIIDVRNPARPTLVGRVLISTIELQVVDNLVYAIGPHLLQVIDVYNPAVPILHGSVVIPESMRHLIRVDGTIVYVVAVRVDTSDSLPEDLLLFDVHDPDRPVLRGFYTVSGAIADVQIDDGLAYIADPTNGLLILDVRNPAQPIQIGVYQPKGKAVGVQIARNLAYIPTDTNGLQIIDVHDPASPILYGSFETPGAIRSMGLEEGFAYVADQEGQVWVIDVRDEAGPTVLGRVDTAGTIGQLQVIGGRVYMTYRSSTTSMEGFRIVDVRDPTHPILRGGCDLPGTTVGIQVHGNIAYTTSNIGHGDGNFSSYFAIVDVSNPDSPAIRGSFSTTTTAQLQVEGNVAYLIQPSSIQILDVTDPTAITSLGSYSLPSGFTTIRVVERLAYIATHPTPYEGGKLKIVDLSDPANPTELGSYLLESRGMYAFVDALLIENERLYLSYRIHYGPGADGGELEIVDVRNPSTPTHLGSYQTGRIDSVQISGRLAYLTIGTRSIFNQLDTVDISDPFHPIRRDSYTILGYGLKVQVIGDRAYVSAGSSGLHILLLRRELLTATAVITPTGSSLVSHGANLRLIVPPGAVTNTVTLTYTGMLVPSKPLGLRRGVIRSFALESRTSTGESITHFATPAMLTISYTDTILNSQLIINEASLNLLFWNDGAWKELLPCAGCVIDISQNSVTTNLREMGEYALVGDQRALFLPLIDR